MKTASPTHHFRAVAVLCLKGADKGQLLVSSPSSSPLSPTPMSLANTAMAANVVMILVAGVIGLGGGALLTSFHQLAKPGAAPSVNAPTATTMAGPKPTAIYTPPRGGSNPMSSICEAAHAIRLASGESTTPLDLLAVLNLTPQRLGPPEDSAYPGRPRYHEVRDAIVDAWKSVADDARQSRLDLSGGEAWVSAATLAADALLDDTSRQVYLTKVVPLLEQEYSKARGKRSGYWSGGRGPSDDEVCAGVFSEYCREIWASLGV